MTAPNREKAADQWPRLAGAAQCARDDLRSLASDLSNAMATSRIPRALIIRARDVAARHADCLRLALKHPAAPPERRKFDLPCWSVPSKDRTAPQ